MMAAEWRAHGGVLVDAEAKSSAFSHTISTAWGAPSIAARPGPLRHPGHLHTSFSPSTDQHPRRSRPACVQVYRSLGCTPTLRSTRWRIAGGPRSPPHLFDIAAAEVAVDKSREAAVRALPVGLCRGADALERSQRSPPAGSRVLRRKSMLTDDVIDRMCSRVKLEPDRTEWGAV